MGTKARIGISACLLGQEVRFDGGHKRDPFLTGVLARYVEWVDVCPEVEVGMGTPRETLRLVRDHGGIRMITTRTGIDHTDSMIAWAKTRVEALARDDLDGFVLKKDSPSCGMDRVKVFSARGSVRKGRGLFAEVLLSRLPLLPAEDEGRLQDPVLREDFLERVFAYRRLKDLFKPRWSHGALVRFHTAHKTMLLAHSRPKYEALGRLVATGRRLKPSELRQRYETLFMETLAMPTTKRQGDVLQHMTGHLDLEP